MRVGSGTAIVIMVSALVASAVLVEVVRRLLVS